MMHKLNDELLEKVTGGVGFDYDAMSPEDRARYEELHEQYLQTCYDYGNHLVDQATFFAAYEAWNAFVEGIERKYG